MTIEIIPIVDSLSSLISIKMCLCMVKPWKPCFCVPGRCDAPPISSNLFAWLRWKYCPCFHRQHFPFSRLASVSGWCGSRLTLRCPSGQGTRHQTQEGPSVSRIRQKLKFNVLCSIQTEVIFAKLSLRVNGYAYIGNFVELSSKHVA